MNVLIIGGAGFIGTNLCKELNNRHNVISLDNYSAGSKDNHIDGIKYYKGSSNQIGIIKEKIDVVYHLGEYSRIESSFEDVVKVIDYNINGTINVLEYCKKNKIKLIYAGSSSIYSKETSPYKMTKKFNAEIIKNYGKWYGLDYTITYFYNVYGEGERSGKYGTVIEIFKDRIRNNKALEVVRPGTQKRNFTYIGDIVAGLKLAMNNSIKEVQLGSEARYSILEVAKLFSDNIKMIPERKGNRMDSKIDLTNAKKIGWEAKTKLADYINNFKTNGN